MKKQITPCLWYNNQAKEAATLYTAAFADCKIVAQSPIVSEITISGHSIILLDGGPMFKPNPSISLFHTCENEKRFDHAWNALTKEGSILMEAGQYPWSEKYGWVTDKFGVSWQVSVGAERQKVIASLMFTGKQFGRADEAIEHYSSIFDTPAVDGILRYGANETPEQEGKVKHAEITLSGQKFMLMESAAAHDFKFSEGVSLTVYCETQKEIDYYWEKFTESGKESMCGWVVDKFGVSWQIIPTILGKLMSDPEKAGKAAKAFMTMRKLNIEQIVQATVEG